MISSVIPVWNQHEMTADCINMIRENTKDFELIVVDNGSTPLTRLQGRARTFRAT